MDERLSRLIEQIRLFSFSITGTKDGVAAMIPLEQIFYFDSVENKTYLYVEKDVYQCDKKLYELEQLLKETTFVRISKSCILNAEKVIEVKAQLNGRLEVRLLNREKVLVSKHYIRDFKEKFK
jgi:DNA-binding LytR/AlgR family response regulator